MQGGATSVRQNVRHVQAEVIEELTSVQQHRSTNVRDGAMGASDSQLATKGYAAGATRSRHWHQEDEAHRKRSQ